MEPWEQDTLVADPPAEPWQSDPVAPAQSDSEKLQDDSQRKAVMDAGRFLDTDQAAIKLPAVESSLVHKPAADSQALTIQNALAQPGVTQPHSSFWENITAPLVELTPKLKGKTIVDAMDVIQGYVLQNKEAMERINEGLSREPTATEKVVAGSQTAVAEVIDSFTSPLGIVTLGIGVLPKAAQRAVSGLFAVHMASALPTQAKLAADAIKSGDTEAAAKHITGTALTGAFSALAAKHAVQGEKTVLQERAKDVGPATEAVVSGKSPASPAEPSTVKVGEQPAPTPETPAVEPAAAKSTPSVPVPAVRLKDGTVVEGQPGQIHAQVAMDKNVPIDQIQDRGIVRDGKYEVTGAEPPPEAQVAREQKLRDAIEALEKGATPEAIEALKAVVADKPVETPPKPVETPPKEPTTPTKSPEAPSISTDAAQKAAEASGWTFDGPDYGGLALTPEEAKKYNAKPRLAFTDRREGSPTQRTTTYIDKLDSTPEEIVKHIEAKAAETVAADSAKKAADEKVAREAEFKAMNAKARNEQRQAVSANLKASGTGGGVVLRSKENPDVRLLITPDIAEPGKWRVTREDSNGPSGHHVFDSRDAAIRAASGESFSNKVNGPAYYKTGEFSVERVLKPERKEPARRGPEERPPDIIDTFEAQVGGKLSLPKARQLIEGFKPTGALRKLFSKTGTAPDVAAQGVGFKGTDVEFLEALQKAADARKGMRKAKKAEKELLAVEEKAAVKNLPKLRAGEDQGDLLSKQAEPLALVGEKGVDLERVAREKAAAEAKVEAGKEGTAELVGMGGAVPSEFELSPKTATSIKNATVDRERGLRGLPPAMEPAKRSFGDVWDQAMALIDRDPGYTDDLMRVLRDDPRALTDVEDALLLHRQVELQNEYGKATRDLAQAFDDGRMEDVADQRVRVAGLSDRLLDLYDINKAAGTETGRGLAARKMMAYEDFTLAKMEVEKRAAKGGEQLTDAERAEVAELQRRIEETQKRYDDYVVRAEEALRQRELDTAYRQITGEAKTEPVLDQRAKSLADRIVEAMERQANESREYLRGKLFTLSPDVLFHLSRIGASAIARGTLDFSRWSTSMIGEFGERLQPYLQQVWEASNKFLDTQTARAAGRKESRRKAVKAAMTGEEATAKRAEITAKIKERFDANEGDAITPMVQRLARLFVESGIKDREALVDVVWDVLKQMDPQITRREAMDAISGYGRYAQLTKDQISVELRDLKGQMQQVAKLEDIEARRPPLKTGVERRTPSDEERRLIKLVNEAKRRFGVVVTDPATQLRSALEARKTYYRNQISDLETQIATREKLVKEKTPSPTDTELEGLKARRNELKEEFDGIFGKPDLTDAQRVARAEAAMERSIEEVSKRINEGDIGPRAKKAKLTSPALEAMRAEREQLGAMLDEMKAAANPKKTPEEVALQTLKTRLKRQIATLQDKLAKGDFSTRKPRDIKLDAEAKKLHFEATKAKIDWHRGLMDDRLKRRNIPQKILGVAGEVLNTTRAIITSLDLSAVLRQGGFISFGRPIQAAKAFPAMIRALKSEEGQHAVNQEILARKNYPLYQQSKLYLAEHGQRLSQMEEAYMSRWADKIPGVAGSQRAYVTFLNKLRADTFDTLVATLSRDGEVTPHEAKAIANYINVATGRGSLGMKENAAVGLSTVFFAPRLVASRFQLIAGTPMYRGSARTRKLIAKEYARYLMGIAVVYGLGKLAFGDDAEIEQDPRSSDFGKIRIGNTRLDPLAGLQQVTVLSSRLASGETKKLTGEVVPIVGDDRPYGQDGIWGTIGRFVRTKLSPVVGEAVNVREGENVVGQQVDILPQELSVKGVMNSTPGRLGVPLALRDVYDTMIEQGVPRGTALALLSIFGMGLQTYEDR